MASVQIDFIRTCSGNLDQSCLSQHGLNLLTSRLEITPARGQDSHCKEIKYTFQQLHGFQILQTVP